MQACLLGMGLPFQMADGMMCACLPLQVALREGVDESAVRRLKAGIEATTLGQVGTAGVATACQSLALACCSVQAGRTKCRCVRLCSGSQCAQQQAAARLAACTCCLQALLFALGHGHSTCHVVFDNLVVQTPRRVCLQVAADMQLVLSPAAAALHIWLDLDAAAALQLDITAATVAEALVTVRTLVALRPMAAHV